MEGHFRVGDFSGLGSILGIDLGSCPGLSLVICLEFRFLRVSFGGGSHLGFGYFRCLGSSLGIGLGFRVRLRSP